MSSRLTRSQLLALEHITYYAKKYKEEAQQTIRHVLGMSNISRQTYDVAIIKVKSHARIALHFHPDRPDPNMVCVAEALLELWKTTSRCKRLRMPKTPPSFTERRSFLLQNR
ncbi:DUF3626 domain-containing protein [Brevibacillus invocatus]|uniref:DUF3626 domain-containing protein n=1 Tax=Brevibacillus invocatus TaxID=173959 RepID=UPI002040C0EA|nr:DUF3626 domain-containing protein [Brevibacillus invocatus]MCM3077943.1 DUF3626 domain-containing protein [Brevibacillus invocatus]MCM3427983.1 DUF3626 domain-containing protein [Brevibacillus invocatus]